MTPRRQAAQPRPQRITIAKVTIAGRSQNGNTIYEITDTSGTRRRTSAGSPAGYVFSWGSHLQAAGRQAVITVNGRGTIDSLVIQ